MVLYTLVLRNVERKKINENVAENKNQRNYYLIKQDRNEGQKNNKTELIKIQLKEGREEKQKVNQLIQISQKRKKLTN